MLLLIEKPTDTLIEQTKTKPQETLEFKMIKQMESFSFNPPIILVEDEKWLKAVISFGTTFSVFNITEEKNSFSISTPGLWSSRGGAETIYKLQKLLELRSQNNNDLHVEEIRKRGNQSKVGDKKYNLSDLDTRKNELIEHLKNI